jgi:threonylcarbamoyladenosine tRNA methylthiotransferase MtaB
VIDECVTLIKNGYKEIVLTGICLGAYGKDISKDINLPVLIRELCKAEGEWRLRLSSIEPKDIRDGLIKELASQEKFCKHLHMPFQSGDDYILKKMNRPYTSRDYKDIVHTLRSAVPDIAISTDIMVGFPGETEGRFQNTVNFIKDIKPMRVHIFPFSKRIGTKAYYYKDAAYTAVKRERGAMLLSLVRELSHEFIAKFLGKKAEVLIEGNRSSDGYLNGYTDKYIKVYIKGPDTLRSTMLRCQLTLTNQKVYGILLS